MAIQIKRIYDPPETSDGVRILVDRLWPRGVAKADARLDDWIKELTPSNSLRQWFGHKAENFSRFSDLYLYELNHNQEAQKAALKVIEQSKDSMVTLLYAAKDPQINHAVILQNYLEQLAEQKS